MPFKPTTKDGVAEFGGTAPSVGYQVLCLDIPHVDARGEDGSRFVVFPMKVATGADEGKSHSESFGIDKYPDPGNRFIASLLDILGLYEKYIAKLGNPDNIFDPIVWDRALKGLTVDIPNKTIEVILEKDKKGYNRIRSMGAVGSGLKAKAAAKAGNETTTAQPTVTEAEELDFQ